MQNSRQLISAMLLTLMFTSHAFACGSTYSTGQKKCCGITMTIGLCGGVGNACDFGADWRDCGDTGCSINSAEAACINTNAKREVALFRDPAPEFQRTTLLACNPQQTTAFNEWLNEKLQHRNQ